MRATCIIKGVSCYGDVEEDSNFAVVCENEEDDTDWIVGNMTTNEPFKDWFEVVEYLTKQFAATIVEIHAC